MYSSTLEHLTCFAGGMLGLGARLLEREADLQTGINVRHLCSLVVSNVTHLFLCFTGHRSLRMGI